MKTNELQSKQQSELHTQLWACANDLRGNMDASEFKNYILGLIFYRFLSEQLLEKVNKELEDEDNVTYEEAFNSDDYKDDIISILLEELGYVIEPQFLWNHIVDLINEEKFNITILANAINSINESTLGQKSQEDFNGLFEDMDLNSNKLGKTEPDRTKLISKVILKINAIDFKFKDTEIDVLGDAYEYLIGQFAASAGKKAGEFYTPQQVSRLLSLLVTNDLTDVKYISDPTCGSGSLLIQVAEKLKEKKGKYIHIYGQELNTTTCNLARMNLLVHNVNFNKFSIYQGDTLKSPSDEQREYGKMDIVVANPPFSTKWDPNSTMEKDDRFSSAGKLAPKSYADYAFVQHMINSLSGTGRMAVVLPHGPLFRSGAESIIRKYLVETRNYLDTVIGLPANLFYGTSIPACICVFKKDKKDRNVYFIDASKDFEKGKNQNLLRNEDIEKIIDAYTTKREIEKYAHLASIEELTENDFNLNIPRYVDTFEEEEEIDIQAVMADIKKLESERADLDKQIKVYLKELGIIKEN